MSLTNDLFYALKQFDDVRRGNRDEYLRWEKATERFKGSEGYSKDRAAAERKRNQADDEARKAAAKKIDECLLLMRENLNMVSLVAPTPEQVSILQVLSMRTTMTEQELSMAAKSMNGNPLCLAVLNDIGDKYFPKVRTDGRPPVFHENYMKYSTSLSGAAAESYLNSVVHACKEILKSPVKSPILEHAKAQHNIHGVPFHVDLLPQREPLVSDDAFYGGIVPAEQIDNFMKQVNGK